MTSAAGDAPSEAGHSHRVAIVIACWNHLATTTAPCLDALLRFTDAAYRVIAVDNGSEDGTADHLGALAADDPRVTLVRLAANRGWAGGTLAGLDRLETGDDVVCLLNSDTVVTPGWLSRLLGHLAADPALAAVIPNERPDLRSPMRRRAAALLRKLPRLGPRRPAACPWSFTPGTGPRPPGEPLDRVLDRASRVLARYRGRSAPADPSGFCLMLRREHLATLRGYLGDFERFRTRERAWRELFDDRGLRCRVALDTYVFHARGGSGGYYRYDS